MKVDRVNALSLFPLELFRENWWIKWMFEELGDVFVTDDKSPGGSFTTYFRTIERRDYRGDKMMTCLYYLHELRHLRGFMRRKPIFNWYEWQRAMGQSELDASVTSECIVHFLIPEARAAFGDEQPIWVERFLKDPHFEWFIGQRDIEEIGVLRGMLNMERRRAMATPVDNDYIEYQIRNYGWQNMEWYVMWSWPVACGPYKDMAAWRAVETHFARPDWKEIHADWLAEVSRPLPGPAGSPFPEQAAAFEKVYEESSRKFGNRPFHT